MAQSRGLAQGAWAKRRWAHRTKLCVLIGRLRWPVPRIVARLVQPARFGRGNTSRHLRKDRSMGPARTHRQPQGCREQGEHARHGWLMDGAADDGRWTTGDCIPTFFLSVLDCISLSPREERLAFRWWRHLISTMHFGMADSLSTLPGLPYLSECLEPRLCPSGGGRSPERGGTHL